MLRSVSSFVFFASLTVLAAPGCHAKEPTSPVVGLTKPVAPPQPPDLGRGANRAEDQQNYSMYVHSSVGAMCTGADPFFKFDSSKATAADAPTMQTLVNCMLSGPLRGKSIKLLGRTDPRGSEEYNQKLGLERAERIKRYLVTNGVDSGRVQTGSLGKEDSRPSPDDWPGDRRVEILLAD